MTAPQPRQQRDGAPSLRLLARRINECEGLAADLTVAMTRAHGELVSGRVDAAKHLLELGMRKAAAYGKRR